MLVRRGRLEEDAAAGLLAWRHSGFSVHHAIRVGACDTGGVDRTRGARARRLAGAGKKIDRLH